jgi:hypothetical protein
MWGPVGERPAEGADPINTRSLPRTNYGGREQDPTRAAARDAGGRPARSRTGQPLLLTRCAEENKRRRSTRAGDEGGTGVSQDSPDSGF